MTRAHARVIHLRGGQWKHSAVVLDKRAPCGAQRRQVASAIQDPLPQAEVVSSIVDQTRLTDSFRGMGPGFRQDDRGVCDTIAHTN